MNLVFCTKVLNILIYLNLYIYPPDSQESDGGAVHRVSNSPDLFLEMPRYCCPVEIVFWSFNFIEIKLKFRTACQDRQAEESAVKCLSQ